MSADNWLCVAKVEDAKGYGIFYCSGDGRTSFKKVDTEYIYLSPIRAILTAHELHNNGAYYEYGPAVDNEVLKEALAEHA